MARGRKKNTQIGFVESSQKDGGFCPHLDSVITKRLVRYCRLRNLNKTKFVTDCINAQLDVLEKEIYDSMSKEELIEILLSMKEAI